MAERALSHSRARVRCSRCGAGILLLALSIMLATAALAADRTTASSAVYVSDSAFGDVMDGLRLAIEERGLVINNIMHMNEMLERTGADLGMDQPLFGDAESVEFCSAVLSRRMMAEDPTRIVNCPFIIAVYTLLDQPGKTFVTHRRWSAEALASSQAMTEVATMLEQIAEQAVTW